MLTLVEQKRILMKEKAIENIGILNVANTFSNLNIKLRINQNKIDQNNILKG